MVVLRYALLVVLLGVTPLRGHGPGAKPGSETVAELDEERPKTIRKRASGRALDLEGKAWSGAEVVFAARFRPGSLNSRLDVVRVISDARGRFAAHLRLGLRYDVWASGVDRSGRRVMSSLESALAEGRVTLAQAWRHEDARLRITGRKAWAARGPLRYRLLLDSPSAYPYDLAVDDDGVALLPVTAPVRRALLVEDAKGAVISIQPLRKAERTNARDGEFRIELPRPIPILVRCTSMGSEQAALADATVRLRVSRFQGLDVWAPVGRTDADGWATVFVTPVHSRAAGLREYLSMSCSGGGASFVLAGRSMKLQPGRDTDELRAKEAPDIQFRSQPNASTVRGRALLGDGKPLVNRRLAVYTNAGTATQRAFYLSLSPRIVTTGDDGRFEIDGLAPRAPLRIVLELADSDVQNLGVERGLSVSPIAVLAQCVVEGEVDLGDLEVGALARADVSVKRVDGFPAAGVEVVLGEYGRRLAMHSSSKAKSRGQTIMLNTGHPLGAYADRRGRISFLLPRTNAFSIAAVDNGALASSDAVFDVKLHQPFELGLPATIALRGSIRLPSGAPAGGCKIYATPTAFPRVFDTRLSPLLSRRRVHTARDGTFSIGLPFENTPYSLHAIFATGTTALASSRIVVETDEDSVDVENAELTIAIPANNSVSQFGFTPLKSTSDRK